MKGLRDEDTHHHKKGKDEPSRERKKERSLGGEKSGKHSHMANWAFILLFLLLMLPISWFKSLVTTNLNLSLNLSWGTTFEPWDTGVYVCAGVFSTGYLKKV